MMSTDATYTLSCLRWSLTVAVTTIAAMGVGILALFATLIDAQLRQGEAQAYRQGLASRLAAIVYPDDDTGQWVTEGVADDAANSSADAVMVLTADGQVLYQRGKIDEFNILLGQAVADEDEVGVQGLVTLDGAQIAAAPYWDFETIEGAVIVALDSDDTPAHRQLRLDDLHRLVSSAAHASDVVNELLLAGRIDANQLNMRREFIRLDLLVAEFERSVPTLAVEMDQPVTVRGDQTLLRHAIGNIISNAEQHGQINGNVPLIEASVYNDDTMAIVHITDT